jgi:hypothetical protein
MCYNRLVMVERYSPSFRYYNHNYAEQAKRRKPIRLARQELQATLQEKDENPARAEALGHAGAFVNIQSRAALS